MKGEAANRSRVHEASDMNRSRVHKANDQEVRKKDSKLFDVRHVQERMKSGD